MSQVILKDIIEKRFNFSISFANLTSETAVDKKVKMVGVSNEGCVLSLPPKSCMAGHQVLVTVHIVEPDEKMKPKGKAKPKRKVRNIEIIGKVTELETMEDKDLEVRIHFNQYLKDEWQFFLDELEREQIKVMEMIRKLKSGWIEYE